MHVVRLVHETWGHPNRKARSEGPTLRLVHSSTTAKDILRKEAAASFLSALVESEPVSSVQDAVDTAIENFEAQTILFFWNNEQVTDLNVPIPVSDENEALFVRLFALKGG